MRFKTRVKMETARLDMIALINCLFLLNIFFLLSSSVIFQPGVRVNLPSIPYRVGPREANEMFITLTQGGKVYLAEKPCTWEGLKLRLRTLHKSDPSRVLVIKADSGLSHEFITRAIAYAQSAGFTKISLAVAARENGLKRGISP